VQLEKIDFDQLFIVSDLPNFERIDMDTLKSYIFHTEKGDIEPMVYEWALEYHNSIIKLG
jgi:hypothetical protein